MSNLGCHLPGLQLPQLSNAAAAAVWPQQESEEESVWKYPRKHLHLLSFAHACTQPPPSLCSSPRSDVKSSDRSSQTSLATGAALVSVGPVFSFLSLHTCITPEPMTYSLMHLPVFCEPPAPPASPHMWSQWVQCCIPPALSLLSVRRGYSTNICRISELRRQAVVLDVSSRWQGLTTGRPSRLIQKVPG